MKKVLICDDALAMRLIMKKQIENMGHEVVGPAWSAGVYCVLQADQSDYA